MVLHKKENEGAETLSFSWAYCNVHLPVISISNKEIDEFLPRNIVLISKL